jgi:hypothetical protein
LLLLFVVGTFASQDWFEFVAPDKTYKIKYPKSWRTLGGGVPNLLDIVDFQSSEQVRGVIIPGQGARVTVVRAQSDILSPNQWAQNDQRFSTHWTSGPTDLKGRTQHVRRITESHWRTAVGADVELEETAFYVLSDAGLFRIHLTYWPGNRNSVGLRSIALDMAMSIEPNGKR